MTHLKPGDKAPVFTATDQDGKSVSLADFKGRKLVLFFYPKANTPGCTAEACSLRDHEQKLLAKGFAVIGVSADEPKKQKKFSIDHGLPFPLLADTEKNMVKSYGVWGPKKFMGRTFDGIHRTTFIISEDGTIEKVFTQVDTKNHGEQILNEY